MIEDKSMQNNNSRPTSLSSVGVTLSDSSFSKSLRRPLGKTFHMTMPSCIENIPDVANSLVTHAFRIPVSKKVGLYLGIYELLYNAIEHGNFGIDWYQRKEFLSGKKDLKNLYDTRARVANREGKKVQIKFESSSLYTDFTISDDGGGFDHKSHVRYVRSIIDKNKIRRRGILNCLMRFDQLDYYFGGTVVRARKIHKFSDLQS